MSILEPLTAAQSATIMQNIINPRVGISCLLYSAAQPGKVLLGRRKGSHGAGKLAPPGGHLELGEEFEECAAREVQEETGLIVAENVWQIAGVVNDSAIDENPSKHYVTIFMAACISAEQVATITTREPERCEGWDWHLVVDIDAATLFDPVRTWMSQPSATIGYDTFVEQMRRDGAAGQGDCVLM